MYELTRATSMSGRERRASLSPLRPAVPAHAGLPLQEALPCEEGCR